MAGDIGTSVRTYIQTVAAVTNVISTRMFPDVLPQNATLPAIVYTVISGTSVHHLNGSGNFSETRIQIDCYAATRAAANSLGEIVRKNFDTYSGAAGTDTIDNTLAGSPRYDYDPPKDASDLGRYSHSRDYRVLHQEPALSI